MILHECFVFVKDFFKENENDFHIPMCRDIFSIRKGANPKARP